MSTGEFSGAAHPDASVGCGQPEPAVQAIATWFRAQDPDGERFGWAIRDAIDELLDGQRTGRWAYGQLTATQKRHLGTIVQIQVEDEFAIPTGGPVDWRFPLQVEGAPVEIDADCKFSRKLGEWEFPRNMYVDHADDKCGDTDHLALVIWASDDQSKWRAGLIRVRRAILRDANQQWDGKRKLRPDCLNQIYWIWDWRDLPQNRLLHMAHEDRTAVLGLPSGQKRVNAFLWRSQLTVVTSVPVLTLGQQDDAPKRVRDARPQLRPRGLVVLGNESGALRVAELLGLVHVEKGEWLPVRLVTVAEEDPRHKVMLQGSYWAVANAEDAEQPGPIIPRSHSDVDVQQPH